VRLATVAILALAAALRAWRLDQNGYGNEYYSAAVRSMAGSWHNFLYNSFDPAGFVSVDKPPAALWIQVASAKLFGFQPLAVLLPQVLEGLVTVWLVYHLVRRRFGVAAGLLAAGFLAITPVSVAVDRSSNTDTCLVLVLVLAAWALTRAAEEGHRRMLLLSMALIGIGFNVKMLAAFVVLPTFVLVYAIGAPLTWRRRFVDLTLGGVVLAVVSASWILVYDLTPPDRRPFAGSSQQNSMVDLAVGHNGVGRFVRLWGPPRPTASPAAPPAAQAGMFTTPVPPRSPWAGLFVRAPVGPLRLADGQLAGQVGWLFPLALAGAIAGAALLRASWPVGLEHLALILWFGWALTYSIVYSFAGGIFHFYYMATMAPPLAALAGIGTVALWHWSGGGGWRGVALPAVLLVTAAWQVHVQSTSVSGGPDWSVASVSAALSAASARPGDWLAWREPVLLVGSLVGAGVALVLCLPARLSRWTRSLAAGGLTLALLALSVTPLGWALSSVLVPGPSVLPSANLARLAGGDAAIEGQPRSRSGASVDTARLVSFLRDHRRGERYLLATSSTRLAAPIVIETGEPVMAMGGFHGLDRILTPERLARMAATGQVGFVMLNDLSTVSRRMGGEVAGRPIADWVRTNGTLVDPER
jgi:4-amino-4-deoxy-L-arabinose transferase-like glycosyltransferase